MSFTKNIIKRLLVALLVFYPMSTIVAWPSCPSWFSKNVLFGSKVEQEVKKEAVKTAQSSKVASYALHAAGQTAKVAASAGLGLTKATAKFVYNNPKLSVALAAGGYTYYKRDEIKARLLEFYKTYKPWIIASGAIAGATVGLVGAKKLSDLWKAYNALSAGQQIAAGLAGQKSPAEMLKDLFPKVSAASAAAVGAQKAQELTEQEMNELWEEMLASQRPALIAPTPQVSTNLSLVESLEKFSIKDLDYAWNQVEAAQPTATAHVIPGLVSAGKSTDAVKAAMEEDIMHDAWNEATQSASKIHKIPGVKEFTKDPYANLNLVEDIYDVPSHDHPWVGEFHSTKEGGFDVARAGSSDSGVSEIEDESLYSGSDSDNPEGGLGSSLSYDEKPVMISDTEATIDLMKSRPGDRITKILGHIFGYNPTPSCG